MRLLIVALVTLAAGGCDRQVAGGRADGPEVFAEACARCHGAAGKPPDSMQHQLGVRDLTAAEFTGRATRELVLHQVRDGSSNKVMPSFAGTLTEPQIEAVTDFVLGLAPR